MFHPHVQRPLTQREVTPFPRVTPRASHWIVIATVPLLLISLLIISMQRSPVAQAAGPLNVGTCAGASPYSTIQAAVNAAMPGTIINICPKTYAESVNLSLMATTGDITLRRTPGQNGNVFINPAVGSGIYISDDTIFEGNITIQDIKLSTPKYGIDFASFGTSFQRAIEGSVIIAGVNATENDALGAYIRAAGAVTVENSEFSHNVATGLNLTSDQVTVLSLQILDSTNVVEAPHVYINNVKSDFNHGDGIDINSTGNIEIYNSEANNNGQVGQIGFSEGTGIRAFQNNSENCTSDLNAQGALPTFKMANVTTSDNVDGWGTFILSEFDVFISNTLAIHNPYDGIAASAGGQCTRSATINLANSQALQNGSASLQTDQTDAGSVDAQYVFGGYGGIRLSAIGGVNVYSDPGALRGATASNLNQSFGFCLLSDGLTTVHDASASGNSGDGFIYDFDCDSAFRIGSTDVAQTEVSAQDEVGVNTVANSETYIVNNSSAISNTGIGFNVSDPAVDVTMTNISALGNITGVAFSPTPQDLRPVSIDDTSNTIGTQVTFFSSTSSIDNSYIANNSKLGLYYGQNFGDEPIFDSNNAVNHSIVCNNDVGMQAEQYMFVFNKSLGTLATGPGLHVDAKGNWWGDSSGPDNSANPGGSGDSIEIHSFDPQTTTLGVQFAPWIDTIFHSALPNPMIVGTPVALSYQFGNAGLTYFLENGVGDLNGGPLFSLSAQNGTISGDTEKFIVNKLISGQANLTTAGTLKVTLTGPCGLNATDNVLVATPAIHVEKTPDLQGVAPGARADFTVTVANAGNITLTNITVTDPVATSCARSSGTLGDIGIGESVSYSCTLNNVVNNFTNTVTASGFALVDGDKAGNAVSDSDTANVVVASFVLNKTVFVDGFREHSDAGFNPSDCALNSAITVPAGTTVKYCYTITNTGDYTLTKHTLVDDHIPNAILYNFPEEVGPGQSFSTVDAGVHVTKTLTVSTTNIATWTAQIAAPIINVGAEAVNASIPVVVHAQAVVTMSTSTQDQDGDHIPDVVEGTVDTNSNGIPDFLDPAGPTAEPPTDQPLPGAKEEIFLPTVGNQQ